MSKLKYFDVLFTTGPLIKNVAIDYAKDNNIDVRCVNDYFRLILKTVDVDSNNVNMNKFSQKMWNLVVFNKNVLRIGQIVRLVNKRYTGNLYRILGLYDRGFDVENVRFPKYKFYDLDYNSIDKIIQF